MFGIRVVLLCNNNLFNLLYYSLDLFSAVNLSGFFYHQRHASRECFCFFYNCPLKFRVFIRRISLSTVSASSKFPDTGQVSWFIGCKLTFRMFFFTTLIALFFPNRPFIFVCERCFVVSPYFLAFFSAALWVVVGSNFNSSNWFNSSNNYNLETWKVPQARIMKV